MEFFEVGQILPVGLGDLGCCGHSGVDRGSTRMERLSEDNASR